MHSKKIKVLALIEAQLVTAPARIVLNFAQDCRDEVDLTLVTFVRERAETLGAAPHNSFTAAAADCGIPLLTVHESGRFDLAPVSQLKRLCREHKPNIVQTNSVKSHFLLSMIRNRNFGWLAFHHGYTAEDLKMRLYNQADRFSLRACDQVVTVCNAFAAQIENQGVRREKITVIPNGISNRFLQRDEQIRNEWRARLDIAPSDAVVLSIGRLSPEKGHKYLIETVSQITQAGSARNLRVLIAGTGLLEQSLNEQIRAAGLSETVKLIGHHADVRPLFMLADLFVLPSLSEGSPMVLLESMASQVPIVSTNVGGIPEMLTDHESALLVPPANASALGDAISQLLMARDNARQLANAAFERVRDCFSPELYNRRVLHAFESVMARKQPSTPPGVPVPQ